MKKLIKCLGMGAMLLASTSSFAAIAVSNEIGKTVTAAPIDYEARHYTKEIPNGKIGKITWSALGSHTIAYLTNKGNGCIINVRAGEKKHRLFVTVQGHARCEQKGDIVSIISWLAIGG